MRNFRLIRSGVDVSDLESRLLSSDYEEIWLRDTNRQKLSAALKDTLYIPMRRLPFFAENVNESNGVLTIVDDPVIMQLPEMKTIRKICDSVVDAEMAGGYVRIFISRLSSGAYVPSLDVRWTTRNMIVVVKNMSPSLWMVLFGITVRSATS